MCQCHRDQSSLRAARCAAARLCQASSRLGCRLDAGRPSTGENPPRAQTRNWCVSSAPTLGSCRLFGCCPPAVLSRAPFVLPCHCAMFVGFSGVQSWRVPLPVGPVRALTRIDLRVVLRCAGTSPPRSCDRYGDAAAATLHVVVGADRSRPQGSAQRSQFHGRWCDIRTPLQNRPLLDGSIDRPVRPARSAAGGDASGERGTGGTAAGGGGCIARGGVEGSCERGNGCRARMGYLHAVRHTLAAWECNVPNDRLRSPPRGPLPNASRAGCAHMLTSASSSVITPDVAVARCLRLGSTRNQHHPTPSPIAKLSNAASNPTSSKFRRWLLSSNLPVGRTSG